MTHAHHDGSPLYVSTPNPALGTEVTLRVRTSPDVRTVTLRTVPDGDPHHLPLTRIGTTPGEVWWTASGPMTNHVLTYRFLVETDTRVAWLTGTGLHDREVTDAHDFRLTTYPAPPAWTRNAVFYQVFLDRFAPSEAHPLPALPAWAHAASWTDAPEPYPASMGQLYGGSLWGLAERLNHLADLGVTGLYLTPFFPAESTHRYDSLTFDHVDPLLGGDDALRHLTAEASARGIHVIGDLTLNHTGWHHDWFTTALADPDSPEAGFYYIDRATGRYGAFWDIPTLPKLNHTSAELRRRLYEGPDSVVARYVRDFGLAGWRIDVAQSAGWYGGDNLNRLCAQRTAATLASVGGAYLVAEHQYDAAPDLVGDGWHSTMAYAEFLRPVWAWLGADVHGQWGLPGRLSYSGRDLAEVMDAFGSSIPWRASVANLALLDSHDTARARTALGPAAHWIATGLLFTLPGIPMVFAGSELGLEGSDLDAARQPYPWDALADTPGDFQGAVPPTRRRLSDAAGSAPAVDLDLFAFTRTLAHLRRRHPALAQGGLRWLHTGDDVVLYERAHPDETILALAARAAHPPVLAPAPAVSLLDGRPVAAGQPLVAERGFGLWRLL